MIFASIVPTRERSAWPMNLLDDEEVVRTRKTIELEFAGAGRLRKKAESSDAAGGSADGAQPVIIYEIDFAF